MACSWAVLLVSCIKVKQDKVAYINGLDVVQLLLFDLIWFLDFSLGRVLLEIVDLFPPILVKVVLLLVVSHLERGGFDNRRPEDGDLLLQLLLLPQSLLLGLIPVYLLFLLDLERRFGDWLGLAPDLDVEDLVQPADNEKHMGLTEQIADWVVIF